MNASGDGSESVDDFLARIASVKEGRDEAGELELRRKEEEILKSRKERQARRAERARSLSPSKTGPAQLTSTTINSSQHNQAINPPVEFSPSAKPLSRSNAITGRVSPTKDLDAFSYSPRQSPSPEREPPSLQILNSATTLSRNGTLSWQQRPTSKDGPLFRQGLSTSSTAANSPSDPSPREDSSEDRSRKDIAASLAQKDPTWFRQTQDRGLKSAAYRKNQIEDSPTQTTTSRTMQLPGMTQQHEPSKSPTPEARTFRTASPAQSRDLADSDRYKRGNTPDIAALRKSMIMQSPQQQQHHQPVSQDSFSNRPVSMISNSNTDSTFGLDRSSSVISSDRPVSPTKGFGGFVESAMMKRSDSVKRWSVKADVGLRRGDSVLGGRPPSTLHSRGLSRDIHIARDASPSSPSTSSRPESSQVQMSSPDLGSESPANKARQEKDLSLHKINPDDSTSSSVEIPERTSARSQTPQDDSSLARSPSKTTDPRRWSPTKSTWLESALQSKPEPPKLQPLREDQPKWKVDLQRSKSRASRDISPVKAKGQDENKLDVSNPRKLGEEPARAAAEPQPQPVPEKQERQRPASGSKPDHLKLSTKPSPVQPQMLPKAADNSDSTAENTKPVAAMKVTTGDGKDAALATEEERQPPVVKPKPQNTPKTDFRATLRSRAPPSTASTDAEPEFKSIFGKLKRTTTQNYVAPDELKTNILSGKAGLIASAGPQKSIPVDAFKESLLSKKDEIKTTGGKLGQSVEIPSKPAPPLPEALARRKTLSKASAPNLRTILPAPTAASKPDLPTRSMGPKKDTSNCVQSVVKGSTPTPALKNKEMGTPMDVPEAAPEALPPNQGKPPAMAPKPYLLERSVSEEVVSRMREVGATMQSTLGTNTANKITPINPETQSSFKQLSSPDQPITTTGGLPAGSKLASRMNPNLAAMLSRSNSPKLPSTTSVMPKNLAQANTLARTSSAHRDDNSESLTHMTKARAKGPKRRAPKTETVVVDEAQSAVTKSTSAPLPTDVSSSKPRVVDSSKTKPIDVTVSSLKTPVDQAKPILKEDRSRMPASDASAITSTKAEINVVNQTEVSRSGSMRQKPTIVNKSPELRKVSGPLSTDERVATGPRPHQVPSPKPTQPFPPMTNLAASPKPGQPLPSKQHPTTSPRSTQPLPPKSNPTTSPKLTSSLPITSDLKEIITTPTKTSAASKVMAVKNISPKMVSKSSSTFENSKNIKGVAPSPKPSSLKGLGLGVQSVSQAPKPIAKPRILTTPVDDSAPSTAKSNLHEIKDKIEEYVGTIDKGQTKADFDAQQFLAAARDGPAKVKRKNYTVHEITGDGKKVAMPPQQEHILYEETMYLITHNFINSAGTNLSEVYLWYGDRISDAAVEDVQLFCRKDAREHNTKLEVVKQGKESSNLIEALGGILITRRSKSSSFYMLCGRRHLGQIVFDEIDMDPGNLCPGFVYLISAQFGKFYLWKGKGAGADEVGSAKLIGMDLGLTGEIEEVEQGSETTDFWQSLGGGKSAQWSVDWNKRADVDGYPTVMYRVDHERPGVLGSLWALKRAASPAKNQSLKATCQRLEPFSQHDLETPAIHIVDAYRSFYVLINDQSAARASELITSMYLVQDLAMLSPSIQDRPLLPRCYVVIGEPTADVKACFRKWSVVNGYSLGGKESLCVTLEEAIESLGL